MADGLLAPYEYRTYVDPTGQPYSGGLIYTYLAGTLLAATTWTTSTITGGGAVPNSNPVVLDSAGGCVIYLDPAVSYKFIGKDVSGVTFYSQDNIGYAQAVSAVQDFTLNRVSSAPTGTTNNYDLNALTTLPGVKVSYWTWNGASACTLTGITGFSDGDSIFVENITSLSAGQLLTFSYHSGSSAAANRFTTNTGADLILQAGERAHLVNDASIVSTGSWRVVSMSRPAPPTKQALTAGTVYLASAEPATRGIGIAPWTGEVRINLAQSSGGDGGGTITVASDTSNPPTTVVAFWNYGPGVAQMTPTVQILAGDYFKITLTGSATGRTVAAQWLGGPIT